MDSSLVMPLWQAASFGTLFSRLALAFDVGAGYDAGAAVNPVAGSRTPQAINAPTHAFAWFFVGTRIPPLCPEWSVVAAWAHVVMGARAGQPQGWPASLVAGCSIPVRAATTRIEPRLVAVCSLTNEVAPMAITLSLSAACSHAAVLAFLPFTQNFPRLALAFDVGAGYDAGAAVNPVAGIRTPQTINAPTHAFAWFFVGTRIPPLCSEWPVVAAWAHVVMGARAGPLQGGPVSFVAGCSNSVRAATTRLEPRVGSFYSLTNEVAPMAITLSLSAACSHAAVLAFLPLPSGLLLAAALGGGL
ncbi:MAG: ash family protein [Aeromonas sp.]